MTYWSNSNGVILVFCDPFKPFIEILDDLKNLGYQFSSKVAKNLVTFEAT